MKTRISILIALSLIVASFFVGRNSVRIAKIPEQQNKTDTIIKRDTIIPKPIKPKMITKTIHDTLKGTVDSVPYFVDVPISKTVYHDSTYKAIVSGYRASLDSLFITHKIIVKTQNISVKIKPKVSIGLTAGYGASKQGLSPFVGIGITYNFISW